MCEISLRNLAPPEKRLPESGTKSECRITSLNYRDLGMGCDLELNVTNK